MYFGAFWTTVGEGLNRVADSACLHLFAVSPAGDAVASKWQNPDAQIKAPTRKECEQLARTKMTHCTGGNGNILLPVYIEDRLAAVAVFEHSAALSENGFCLSNLLLITRTAGTALDELRKRCGAKLLAG